MTIFDEYKNSQETYSISPSLLWEYDLSHFDWWKSRKIVVQRILERGWLKDYYAAFHLYGGIEGFREIIKQTERIIVPKRELSNDDLELLDRIVHQVQPGMVIKVIYYDKGQYVQFKGKVAKLDLENKKIQIVKKTLDLNDIVEMDIE